MKIKSFTEDFFKEQVLCTQCKSYIDDNTQLPDIAALKRALIAFRVKADSTWKAAAPRKQNLEGKLEPAEYRAYRKRAEQCSAQWNAAKAKSVTFWVNKINVAKSFTLRQNCSACAKKVLQCFISLCTKNKRSLEIHNMYYGVTNGATPTGA